MIFGQLNRDHEKHSIPVSISYIKKSVDIYAKYDVIPNSPCMDEIKQDERNILARFLRKPRTILKPSQRVFIRGSQLICHPDVAQDIERTLREYTAKALDTVE